MFRRFRPAPCWPVLRAAHTTSLTYHANLSALAPVHATSSHPTSEHTCHLWPSYLASCQCRPSRLSPVSPFPSFTYPALSRALTATALCLSAFLALVRGDHPMNKTPHLPLNPIHCTQFTSSQLRLLHLQSTIERSESFPIFPLCDSKSSQAFPSFHHATPLLLLQLQHGLRPQPANSSDLPQVGTCLHS